MISPFLILPILAALIAQTAKFFIRANHLKFKLRNLISYSGMPSGHAALTVSLATIIGLKTGISSPTFAISVILTLLTIRDAVGLRKQLGKQGEVINGLVDDLEEDSLLDEKYPVLLEKIGHSKSQILIGGIIGFLVSLIGSYFL
jgi:hypothetical protein